MSTLSGVPKEFKPYFKELISIGWSIEFTRKSIRLKCPTGGIVMAAKTPSCYFALYNIKREVKKLQKSVV